MEKIYIAYIAENTYETLKKNANNVTQKINSGLSVEEWMKDYSNKPTEALKYQIPKIKLDISESGDYSEVD